MTSRPCWRLLICSALLVTARLGAADGPNPVETRLREQLRAVTLQERSAQADLAAAQASVASLTEEKKTLSDQLAALRKQVAAEKSLSDKSLTQLKARVTEQHEALQKFEEALQQARAEAQKTAKEKQASEAELAQLKEEAIVLSRRVADRERKNLAMFIVANQILTRFEDFSLGRALAAKEPFVGRTRVKLENLMQDYEDQLAAQRPGE